MTVQARLPLNVEPSEHLQCYSVFEGSSRREPWQLARITVGVEERNAGPPQL